MSKFPTILNYWQRANARMPLEALLWVVGLLLLASMSPGGTHLFSFCPFSWVLESGCPGCGLGHGIAYLARGEWQASWAAHPLAAPAVLLLLWRCGSLLYFHRTHSIPSETLK